jgi:RNA polymerase sigma factor (sigma-70 family)
MARAHLCVDLRLSGASAKAMDDDSSRALDLAMARLADGDRSACEPLFIGLSPRLKRFAERALGPGPDADDAAQQALEKIFRQAASYDASRSVLPWAFAVVGWECRTILQTRRRRNRREGALAPAEMAASEHPDPETFAVDSALRQALRACIGQLTETEQRSIEAAFAEDVSGAGDAAARKRKQRTLARLRAVWRKLYDA